MTMMSAVSAEQGGERIMVRQRAADDDGKAEKQTQ